MTESDDKLKSKSPGEDELVAMFKGSIPEDEKVALQEQINADPDLQKEMEFLKSLHQGIKEQDISPPGDIGLARLKRDIQKEKKQISSVVVKNNFWKPLAISACFIMGVQLFLSLPMNNDDPEIELLSGSEEFSGMHLQVAFSDTATAAEIQQALNTAQANIIAGPSALGIYTIALAEGTDSASTVSHLQGLVFVEEVVDLQGTRQ